MTSLLNPASGCAKCPALVTSRQSIVWGRGPTPADIMVIGESPGGNEDRDGQPFVGRSGQLLNKLLRDAGLDDKKVHFTNVIMCHPTGDRDPEPEEVANCYPWLTQHIREVDPLGIILVGRFAIGARFQANTVRDTEGLMYFNECDACGSPNWDHSITAYSPSEKMAAPSWSQDGQVRADPLGRCFSGKYARRRVYAATYHPAAAGRNAEYVPLVLSTLRRLADEIALLRQAREVAAS